MLLDTESFDYTFHLKAGEGFKIAIHHHLDQPIMSIKVASSLSSAASRGFTVAPSHLLLGAA